MLNKEIDNGVGNVVNAWYEAFPAFPWTCYTVVYGKMKWEKQFLFSSSSLKNVAYVPW